MLDCKTLANKQTAKARRADNVVIVFIGVFFPVDERETRGMSERSRYRFMRHGAISN